MKFCLKGSRTLSTASWLFICMKVGSSRDLIPLALFDTLSTNWIVWNESFISYKLTFSLLVGDKVMPTGS